MKKIDIISRMIVDSQLDGIILSSNDNRFWYTNFDSSAGFLFINKEKKSIFLVDGRYYENACLFLLDNHKVDKVLLLEPSKSLKSQIQNILNELQIKKVGIESEYINLKEYEFYKSITEFEFIAFDSIKLRTIKDEEEIHLLQKAADIAAETIEWIKQKIRPGMSELDVANMISKHMLDLGASKNSFDPIVASGINGSFPHHKPTNKIIKEGEMITIDIGCIYKGYCSDITRSFILGTSVLEKEIVEIYNIVLKAQLAGIDAATNKITGKDLDLVCRKIIDNTKYKEYFVHSTGHGVGIQVHEEPYVSSKNSNILENNSIITIEPGIYIPGLGGVRIEDTIVIKNNKPIVLTNKANKEIFIRKNNEKYF